MEKLSPDFVDIPSVESIEQLDEGILPYLSVASAAELRRLEYALRSQFRIDKLKSDPRGNMQKLMSEADAETFALLDDLYTDYLKQFIDEDDPEFNEQYSLLRSTAIDTMSDEIWSKGKKPLGAVDYDEDTSGWRKLYDYRKNKLHKTDDDEKGENGEDDQENNNDLDPPIVDPEKIEELNRLTGDIQRTRDAYALARARQSQTLRSGGKRNDEANQAEAAWVDAMKNFAAVYQEKALLEKPADISSEDWQAIINAQLVAGSIQERLLLEQSRVQKLEDHKMNKFVGWLNKGGITRRLIKSAAIGAGVGVAAIPLASAGAAIGMAGIIAGGSVALWRFTRSFAGWQHRAPNARDLMQSDQTRFTEALQNGETGITNATIRQISAAEAIQKMLAKSRELDINAAERDRSQLRKSVAIGAGAVALGAAVSWGIHFASSKTGVSDWIHDRMPWNHEKPTTKPSTGSTTGGEEVPPPFQNNEITNGVKEVIPPPVALPTNAELHTWFMGTGGNYPWDHAVQAFNGNETAATNWIKEAAFKAGAVWHNEGTRNAWISINGRSDTEYVWTKLVDASFPTN